LHAKRCIAGLSDKTGAATAAKAPADGYTLLMTDVSFTNEIKRWGAAEKMAGARWTDTRPSMVSSSFPESRAKAHQCGWIFSIRAGQPLAGERTS
jgi:hypothetical protein